MEKRALVFRGNWLDAIRRPLFFDPFAASLGIQRPAIRSREVITTRAIPFHLEPCFVHELVMCRTQDEQIAEVRFTAVRPMFDVMRVEMPCVMATGKRASTITREERAFERRRNQPTLSADIQHFTVTSLYDRRHRAVATQSAHRRQRQIGLPSHAAQRRRIDMHDDSMR